MYWNAVLQEVLNKHNASYPFLYTNVKDYIKPTEQDKSPEEKAKRKERLKSYYLGKHYGDLYLTRREAECMVQLMRGKTVPQTAKLLQLSSRTVEFYVKNIKIKLKCRTKSELLQKILASDFMENVDFITV